MTALKAHEVARYLGRPDLREGVFLAYGPDAGLVRETGQRLLAHLSDNGEAEIVVLEGAELERSRRSGYFAKIGIRRIEHPRQSCLQAGIRIHDQYAPIHSLRCGSRDVHRTRKGDHNAGENRWFFSVSVARRGWGVVTGARHAAPVSRACRSTGSRNPQGLPPFADNASSRFHRHSAEAG